MAPLPESNCGLRPVAGGGEISVERIARLALRFAPQPWRFAQVRRAEIEAYFAALRQEKPAVWNGRVLLLHEFRLQDGVLSGDFLETDFASFAAWRDWGFPDDAVSNCFAMAALRSSDGAWLVGVMAPHTANGGQIYFPCGTPDPSDIAGEAVDLGRSVLRELREETGLTGDAFTAVEDWWGVFTGRTIALMKVMQSQAPAVSLRRRILDHLASEATPELADIRIIRDRRDLDPMMPPFMIAFLNSQWS